MHNISERKDVYSRITAQIVEQREKGVRCGCSKPSARGQTFWPGIVRSRFRRDSWFFRRSTPGPKQTKPTENEVSGEEESRIYAATS